MNPHSLAPMHGPYPDDVQCQICFSWVDEGRAFVSRSQTLCPRCAEERAECRACLSTLTRADLNDEQQCFECEPRADLSVAQELGEAR